MNIVYILYMHWRDIYLAEYAPPKKKTTTTSKSFVIEECAQSLGLSFLIESIRDLVKILSFLFNDSPLIFLLMSVTLNRERKGNFRWNIIDLILLIDVIGTVLDLTFLPIC